MVDATAESPRLPTVMPKVERDIALIFINDPPTPIPPWEESMFRTTRIRQPVTRFWRMLIAIRPPSTPDRAMNAPAVWLGRSDQYSRASWVKHGIALRRTAERLAVERTTVYCIDHDPAENTKLPDGALEWRLKLPVTIGATRSTASRLTGEQFPLIDWPAPAWLSGAALFFRAGTDSAYEDRLHSALSSSNHQLAHRLMMGPRVDIEQMQELMKVSPLYLYANSLAMPESSDPWYYLPSGMDVQRALEIAAQELRPSGCQVWTSRRMNDYLPWFEESRLPPDAQPLHCQEHSV